MIIGLTGGIGTGKSTVARLFEMMGCVVFNSDIEAKLAYFKPEIKEKVQHLLGSEAYIDNKTLNKKFIGSKIFSNTDLLHRLNEIIHPEVGKSFSEFKKLHPGKIIIKETALLFEAKLEQLVDKVVLVTSKDEIRIKRVIARDKISSEDVIKKIKSQLPEAEKIKRADFVIYNNEEEFLITQVLNIYNSLKPENV